MGSTIEIAEIQKAPNLDSKHLDQIASKVTLLSSKLAELQKGAGEESKAVFETLSAATSILRTEVRLKAEENEPLVFKGEDLCKRRGLPLPDPMLKFFSLPLDKPEDKQLKNDLGKLFDDIKTYHSDLQEFYRTHADTVLPSEALLETEQQLESQKTQLGTQVGLFAPKLGIESIGGSNPLSASFDALIDFALPTNTQILNVVHLTATAKDGEGDIGSRLHRYLENTNGNIKPAFRHGSDIPRTQYIQWTYEEGSGKSELLPNETLSDLDILTADVKLTITNGDKEHTIEQKLDLSECGLSTPAEKKVAYETLRLMETKSNKAAFDSEFTTKLSTAQENIGVNLTDEQKTSLQNALVDNFAIPLKAQLYSKLYAK